MGIEALLSTQIIDTTTVGRAVMTAADAAAARTAIGAGTSSFSGAYSALSGIPSTFAPSAHKTSHATGGSDALTAADIGAATTSHTHAASDITSGIIGTARLATGTASASTYLRGDQTWASVSAGVGGSTGSVDNGVLRADGTGGSTVQSSDWIIADNYTASPNNTVNHASIQATGGTTNVSVSLVPKGTGAFCLAVPDGTSAGGNARGANAVDFQTSRSSATQVAAGIADFQGGANNTTNAGYAATFGQSNTNTGAYGFVSGQNNTNSATWGGTFGGFFSVASAFGAVTLGGIQANAYRRCMRAFAANAFSSVSPGDCQGAEVVLQGITTTNTPVELLISQNTRLTVPSGIVCHFLFIVTGVRQGGADVAYYMRRATVKNIGGTVSLVGSVDTIGTDVATGTSLSITADNTNKAISVAPTGVLSQNWRWNCIVYGGELGHA